MVTLGLLLAALTLLSGLWFHQVTVLGSFLIIEAGLALFVYVKARSVPIRTLAFINFLALSLLAGLSGIHRLPGISNPVALDSVRYAADSLPFKMYLNVDKAFMGFFIVCFLIPEKELVLNYFAVRRTTLTLGALVAVLMPVGLLIRYAQFDPGERRAI